MLLVSRYYPYSMQTKFDRSFFNNILTVSIFLISWVFLWRLLLDFFYSLRFLWVFLLYHLSVQWMHVPLSIEHWVSRVHYFLRCLSIYLHRSSLLVLLILREIQAPQPIPEWPFFWVLIIKNKNYHSLVKQAVWQSSIILSEQKKENTLWLSHLFDRNS